MTEPLSQWAAGFRAKLNGLVLGLANYPERAMGRNPAKREEVLRFLLPFACQAQRVEGVEAGRRYIAAIPRLWLLENVERVAEELLDLSDEWEHERLVDLYEHLEAPDHKARLLVRGLVRGD